MRIFAGGSSGKGVKNSGVDDAANLRRFRGLFCSEALDKISRIYLRHCKRLDGFSVISKCVTLNDPEYSYFTLNSGFPVGVKYFTRCLLS